MKKTIFKALSLFLVIAIVASFALISAPEDSSAATYYRIKNAWNGNYLYVASGQVKYGTPAATDATSQWEFISYNGNTQIKNVGTGLYMHVQNQQAYVEASAITVSWTSAQWSVESYNGNTRIRNIAYNNRYVNIEGLAGYAKCTTIYDVWMSAQWVLETVTVTTTPTPTPTGAATPTPTPAATPTPTPTSGTSIAIPGRVEAESYSTMSGIQTENSSDGTLNVGWTDTGDWMDYTVNVAVAGTYRVDARVASPNTNTSFKLQKSGTDLATITVPNTGGWQTWTTTSANVTLSAGVQTLRLYVSGGGFNVNYLDFSASTASPTPTATPAATPTPTTSPVAGIDLVATNITWTPANPTTGQEVTFSVVIKNQGGTSSPSGVKHGISFMVNGTQVNWCDNFNTSLAPGATATLTANGGPSGKASWTATSGTPTVRAFVDDVNLINESYEANNTFDKTITIGAGPTPTPSPTPTQAPPSTPTPPPSGRGATVPYIAYEAENGTHNGQLIGPNRTVGNLGGEASGRKAVRLTSGQYVQWTTTATANSIVIRNSIPDAAGGNGITATISLYVNNVHRQDITLSSRHSWLYGDETSPNNNPGSGNPRRIYDEASAMVGDIPAGATVKLQVDAGDTAAYYGIDFIELEQVATAKSKPTGYYSITDYGAVANDSNDDTGAIQNAINAAQSAGTGVYIPSGTFIMTSKLTVSGITVQGAGMWYSKLVSPDWVNNGNDGNFGFAMGGNNTKFFDLALFSNGTIRGNGGMVWSGNARYGTQIGRVWVEHSECAYWVVGGDTLRIFDSRFRNTYADGVNLCNTVVNSVVENCTARTTGDDAFAMFSALDRGATGPNVNNTFRNLTVQNVWRAAGIAIYGGQNITVENSIVYDTLTYPGLTISSLNFDIPMAGFSGTTTIRGITLERCGGQFWGTQTFPALWVYGGDAAFTGIRFSNININNSTFQGIGFASKYQQIKDTTFTGISITNSGNYGIWANPTDGATGNPASGSVTFSNTTVTGSGSSNLYNPCAGFSIINGGGNSW